MNNIIAIRRFPDGSYRADPRGPFGGRQLTQDETIAFLKMLNGLGMGQPLEVLITLSNINNWPYHVSMTVIDIPNISGQFTNRINIEFDYNQMWLKTLVQSFQINLGFPQVFY